MSLPHMNGGAVSAAAAVSAAHHHHQGIFASHHHAAALGLGGLGLGSGGGGLQGTGLQHGGILLGSSSNGGSNSLSSVSHLGGQLVASPSIDSVSTSGIGSASGTPISNLNNLTSTTAGGSLVTVNQSATQPPMATSPHPTVNAIQERFLAHYDASFQWLIQEAQKGCDHLTMSRLLKEMRNAFWDLMGYAVKKAESQAQAQALLIQQQQLNAQLQAQLQNGLAAQQQAAQQQQQNGQNGHGPPPKRGRKPKGNLQNDLNGSSSTGSSNDRDLADYIGDSQGPAYTLEQANARINQIKSSNLHITVSSDMERVNEWLALRPGTSGHSLTIEQRRDVVQFYEMFKPKYSVKWLICQIEQKYGLSSLRGYFTRFMSKCYKVTNQGVKQPRGAAAAGTAAGGGRGRKPGVGRGAGKYRSIESMISSGNGNGHANGDAQPPVNGGGNGTTPKKKGTSNGGIGRNRSGKLGQTAAEDLDRVEAWVQTGTKRDGNLTVDQKRDVIHFYEAFREKYIPAWLAKQIARKYDMKKLQFDFNRFMARCYKSTGQMDADGHHGGPAASVSDGHHAAGHGAGPSVAHQHNNQQQHPGLNGGDKLTPEPESSSSAGSKTPLSAGLPLQLTARTMISNPVLNMSNGGGQNGGANGGQNGGSNGGGSNQSYNGLMHQIVASQANRALSLRVGDHLGGHENGNGNGSAGQQEAMQEAALVGSIGGQAWPGSRVGLNIVRQQQEQQQQQQTLGGLEGELDPQQIQELCELSQRQAQAAAMKMEQHFQYY